MLVHARKVFGTTRMLGFSLKLPYGKTETETLGENARAMNVSENMHHRFADVLLNLTRVTIVLAICSPSVFFEVLAARTRKNKRTARMLAKRSQRPLDTPIRKAHS